MARALRALFAVAAVMLVLDLTWLAVVAAALYRSALGPLMAPETNVVAAALFYVMYVGATTVHAALADTVGVAARRGAALGFVAYATYELTNWAVIAGWPAWLVPIDLVWGVVLTGVSAAAGRAAAGPAQ